MPNFLIHILCLTMFCGLLYLAIIGAVDNGPYCPGADPAWLGNCVNAPLTQ